jgi:hypothetical protein
MVVSAAKASNKSTCPPVDLCCQSDEAHEITQVRETKIEKGRTKKEMNP